jgi:hypothetical protein
MIGASVDVAAADPSPRDEEIVAVDVRVRAERAQPFHDPAEPVRLFDAELAGAGEA